MLPATGTPAMKTRREVLQAMAAVGASGWLSAHAAGGAEPPGGKVPAGIRFGTQLNAFPIDAKNFNSFLSVLAEVKGIGLECFESSFRNLSPQFADPAPARRSIEQTGLVFFGVHIFFPDDQYDPRTKIAAASVYEPIARGGAALGARYLILSSASAANGDELKRKIDGLNTAGRFAAAAGIPLAYHNHFQEFRSPLGEMEALYAGTDPSLVHFLLDAGHAWYGGADLRTFIPAHAGRIVGMHLHDFKNGVMVTLGTGNFPLSQFAAAVEQAGWKGWIECEEERNDHSQPGLEAVASAYRSLVEAFSQ